MPAMAGMVRTLKKIKVFCFFSSENKSLALLGFAWPFGRLGVLLEA
jgi:hypothetical protein